MPVSKARRRQLERLTVARRPGRTTLALALPILVFVLFGMARVVAPVSALGLVFDEPAGFAVVAAVLSVAGAALLFVRPVELRVAPVLAGDDRRRSPRRRTSGWGSCFARSVIARASTRPG